uniref:Uncharacterized protein n=1 Tax=Ananas comosus var. bracteatus TaxID=296719 RepID=A0A6V7QN87_ANACO|nr:unnamed protein product [Ananas comosus var. bracteatus]
MVAAAQLGVLAACVVLFVPMGMAGWHLSRNKMLFFSGALFITLAVGVHLTPYFPSIPTSSPPPPPSSSPSLRVPPFLHRLSWSHSPPPPAWAWSPSAHARSCGFQRLSRADASDLLRAHGSSSPATPRPDSSPSLSSASSSTPPPWPPSNPTSSAATATTTSPSPTAGSSSTSSGRPTNPTSRNSSAATSAPRRSAPTCSFSRRSLAHAPLHRSGAVRGVPGRPAEGGAIVALSRLPSHVLARLAHARQLDAEHGGEEGEDEQDGVGSVQSRGRREDDRARIRRAVSAAGRRRVEPGLRPRVHS